MNDTTYILALDVSSRHIGYVLYHGAVIDHGEWHLTGDIAERCRRAYNAFQRSLDRVRLKWTLSILPRVSAK